MKLNFDEVVIFANLLEKDSMVLTRLKEVLDTDKKMEDFHYLEWSNKNISNGKIENPVAHIFKLIFHQSILYEYVTSYIECDKNQLEIINELANDESLPTNIRITVVSEDRMINVK